MFFSSFSFILWTHTITQWHEWNINNTHTWHTNTSECIRTHTQAQIIHSHTLSIFGCYKIECKGAQTIGIDELDVYNNNKKMQLATLWNGWNRNRKTKTHILNEVIVESSKPQVIVFMKFRAVLFFKLSTPGSSQFDFWPNNILIDFTFSLDLEANCLAFCNITLSYNTSIHSLTFVWLIFFLAVICCKIITFSHWRNAIRNNKSKKQHTNTLEYTRKIKQCEEKTWLRCETFNSSVVSMFQYVKNVLWL